jgi:hypothetical protein
MRFSGLPLSFVGAVQCDTDTNPPFPVSDACTMVETLQPAGLALIILFPSLATVVVALRVYTRISMRQSFLGNTPLVLNVRDCMPDNNVSRRLHHSHRMVSCCRPGNLIIPRHPQDLARLPRTRHT